MPVRQSEAVATHDAGSQVEVEVLRVLSRRVEERRVALVAHQRHSEGSLQMGLVKTGERRPRRVRLKLGGRQKSAADEVIVNGRKSDTAPWLVVADGLTLDGITRFRSDHSFASSAHWHRLSESEHTAVTW